MNKISNSVKKYVNQTGVLSSIIVTLCGLVSFSISLIGIEYGHDELLVFNLLSLVIELAYSIIFSFMILKNRSKYLHLLPFLFSNWFIGCFSLNIFMNVFENSPIWVYAFINNTRLHFTNYNDCSCYIHKF